MKESLGLILVIIGWLAIAVSTVSGIGMFLYEWGKIGLEVGPSAWEGFVLFTKMIGIGIATLLLGAFLS